MAIEMNTDLAVCYRCSKGYGRRKGYFPVSYAASYRGVGYLPICKDCVDAMYNEYLAQCKNAKEAVRQMCRKLDLYWDEKVYGIVERKNTTRSMMTQYIAKINSITYAGKCYDDTLSKEGTLWSFDVVCDGDTQNNTDDAITQDDSSNSSDDVLDVPEDVIAFWGVGYSADMYQRLEQRRRYYTKKFPDAFPQDDDVEDIGSDILMRQICNLEVSIANDAAAGRSIEKSVNSLNTLIGSLNLKPAQKEKVSDNTDDKTPFGVWIRRFENEKPIPEPDPEFDDVDGIKKYVLVWVYGHLMKMLGGGKENSYSRLYEAEIEKLRVDKPEYADDEDDEDLLYDVFSEKDFPGATSYDDTNMGDDSDDDGGDAL